MEGIIFIMMFVWLSISVYTGVHASDRGKSGVLWFFAVGIFGVLGLVAYAISLAGD